MAPLRCGSHTAGYVVLALASVALLRSHIPKQFASSPVQFRPKVVRGASNVRMRNAATDGMPDWMKNVVNLEFLQAKEEQAEMPEWQKKVWDYKIQPVKESKDATSNAAAVFGFFVGLLVVPLFRGLLCAVTLAVFCRLLSMELVEQQLARTNVGAELGATSRSAREAVNIIGAEVVKSFNWAATKWNAKSLA